jgi:hypothetical protein
MRDGRPYSEDIVKFHPIPAVGEHDGARASKEGAGKVSERCLVSSHRWCVRCKRRIDVCGIARKGECMRCGDVKWDEKHAREGHAGRRGYQHLIDCVWIGKEID